MQLQRHAHVGFRAGNRQPLYSHGDVRLGLLVVCRNNRKLDRDHQWRERFRQLWRELYRGGQHRRGTLTVGGQTVTVTQAGATPPSPPTNFRIIR